jgi:hypothetical protein
VADDKKKEADPKAGEAKKKKGLPAIVLVVVGAVFGGAGVVVAVPPKVKQVHVPAPVLEVIEVTHPDAIKKTLNPQSASGKGTARVEFKFVYSVREDRERDAFERIKTDWDEVNSKALKMMKNRSIKDHHLAREGPRRRVRPAAVPRQGRGEGRQGRAHRLGRPARPVSRRGPTP